MKYLICEEHTRTYRKTMTICRNLKILVRYEREDPHFTGFFWRFKIDGYYLIPGFLGQGHPSHFKFPIHWITCWLSRITTSRCGRWTARGSPWRWSSTSPSATLGPLMSSRRCSASTAISDRPGMTIDCSSIPGKTRLAGDRDTPYDKKYFFFLKLDHLMRNFCKNCIYPLNCQTVKQ